MTEDTKHKIDSYVNELWDLITNSDNLTDLYNMYIKDTKNTPISMYEKINKDDILKQMFVKINDIIKNFEDEEHEDILDYLGEELEKKLGELVPLYQANKEDKQVCIAARRFETLVNELNFTIVASYINHKSIRESIASRKLLCRPKQKKLITYIEENHIEAFENIIIRLQREKILQQLYDDNIQFEYKWLGSVLDFTYFVALLNGKKLTECYLKKVSTTIQWQIFLNAFMVCDTNGKRLEKSKECSDKYTKTFVSYRTSIDFNDPQNEKEPYLNCYKIHKIIKETNKYYFQR